MRRLLKASALMFGLVMPAHSAFGEAIKSPLELTMATCSNPDLDVSGRIDAFRANGWREVTDFSEVKPVLRDMLALIRAQQATTPGDWKAVNMSSEALSKGMVRPAGRVVVLEGSEPSLAMIGENDLARLTCWLGTYQDKVSDEIFEKLFAIKGAETRPALDRGAMYAPLENAAGKDFRTDYALVRSRPKTFEALLGRPIQVTLSVMSETRPSAEEASQ